MRKFALWVGLVASLSLAVPFVGGASAYSATGCEKFDLPEFDLGSGVPEGVELSPDPEWSDESAAKRLVASFNDEWIQPRDQVPEVAGSAESPKTQFCAPNGEALSQKDLRSVRMNATFGRDAVLAVTAGAMAYQSDHATLYGAGGDWRSGSWKVYVQSPASNLEFNQCDSMSSAVVCVWFAGTQFDVGTASQTNCGIQIGPLRSTDTSTPNSRTNFGFYCGTAAYPQLGNSVPTNVWVGYLFERIAVGNFYGMPISTWRTYSYSNEVVSIEGDSLLLGDRIRASSHWLEVIEADNPCITDVGPVHFDNARFYNQFGGPYSFSSAIADYESTCPNTTWGRWAYNDDWIVDVRNTARTIGNGAQLWSIP